MADASPIVQAEDVATLMSEIQRYLAAVALFRREGHEPRWSPEWAASRDETVPSGVSPRVARGWTRWM